MRREQQIRGLDKAGFALQPRDLRLELLVLAAELETAGAKVAFTQADVGTEAACLAFVNGAAPKFGRLDILINNAGIRKYEKVDEATAASWNEILNVNLMSYVFCAKAAVPKGGHLCRRGDPKRIAISYVPEIGHVNCYALRRSQFGRPDEDTDPNPLHVVAGDE
jgi:NAD(P)-dependent dehydrogenase (short-subunit alcohol dehydrogenase family)